MILSELKLAHDEIKSDNLTKPLFFLDIESGCYIKPNKLDSNIPQCSCHVQSAQKSQILHMT